MAEKQFMPQSTAGLIRYFDTDAGIKIKPEHVAIVSVFIIVAEVALKFIF